MAVSGAGPAACPVCVRGRRDTGALSTLCSACEAVEALGDRVAPRSWLQQRLWASAPGGNCPQHGEGEQQAGKRLRNVIRRLHGQ